MDRRVRRTRRLLKDAMLELIEEVGWDRVTVGALTERADVGRSTFYSHYGSREDLLLDGFDGWVASVGEPPVAGDRGATDVAATEEGAGDNPSGDRFRFARPLLHHIAGRRRFFLAIMVRSRSSRIRRRVLGMLVGRVSTELGRMGRDAGEIAAHAVAGAFLEVVTWWLDEGSRTPIDEVDQAFQASVGVR
jgi:AcrR family transcriptional regulator